MSVAPLGKKKAFEAISQNFVGVDTLPEDTLRLNRYRNSLPNPHSRIQLKQIGDDATTTFINANHVRGASKTTKYIATMGPLKRTTDAFWRMVWEQKVSIIVMLTGLMEKTVRKCSAYWPANSKQGSMKLEPSGIEVKFVKGQALRDDIVRTDLVLTWNGEERQITHLIYTEFPDHGVPPSAKAFLGLIEYVRRHHVQAPEAPLLVHCSAGIGRTGMFVAADIGIDLLSGSKTVDLAAITKDMRDDRGGMIQHFKQFQFVHESLGVFKSGTFKDYKIDSDLDSIKPGLFAMQLLQGDQEAEKEGDDAPVWEPFGVNWLEFSDNWMHEASCEIDEDSALNIWCKVLYYEGGELKGTFPMYEYEAAVGQRKDRRAETAFGIDMLDGVGTDKASKTARADFGDGILIEMNLSSGNLSLTFRTSKPLFDLATHKAAFDPKSKSSTSNRMVAFSTSVLSERLKTQMDEGIDDEVLAKIIDEWTKLTLYFGKQKEKAIRKGKPPTAHLVISFEAAAVELKRAAAEVDRQVRGEPPLPLRPS
eukprot:m.485161 g.485161  ORF g.485161 m.485161 type:complete len:535 (+) comp23683_c0_seq1:161-1765(+)